MKRIFEFWENIVKMPSLMFVFGALLIGLGIGVAVDHPGLALITTGSAMVATSVIQACRMYG